MSLGAESAGGNLGAHPVHNQSLFHCLRRRNGDTTFVVVVPCMVAISVRDPVVLNVNSQLPFPPAEIAAVQVSPRAGIYSYAAGGPSLSRRILCLDAEVHRHLFSNLRGMGPFLVMEVTVGFTIGCETPIETLG